MGKEKKTGKKKKTSSKALFSPDRSCSSSKGSCLLCKKEIKRTDQTRKITQDSWSGYKDNASTWKKLDVPFTDELHVFTEVYDLIKDVDEAFGTVHTNCHIKFRTRLVPFIYIVN